MGALFIEMLAEVEKLMDRGEHRTVEEDAALDLMVRLIQDYDEEHHPLTDPSPHEMLVFLMEQRGLKQADLLPIFTSFPILPLSSRRCWWVFIQAFCLV